MKSIVWGMLRKSTLCYTLFLCKKKENDMAYNTNTYFIFFLPAVMLTYMLTPRKYRYITLLLASGVFFALISKYLIAWCLLTTIITYFAGLKMDSYNRKAKELPRTDKEGKECLLKKSHRVAFLAIFVVVFILAFLKYTQFTITEINKLFGTAFSVRKLAIPIGISFYTLQAVGYLLDIYWKRISAERNLLHMALFMTFFPTLMEGPILRWDDIKDQLFKGEDITGQSFARGAVRIGWGLFKRMIIADRMSVMINMLFRPTKQYHGFMIIFIMVSVSIQLYLEFSGTIDIVIGSAEIFGIRLPENFRQPFLSQNAAEFWRRWHISLGTWFKNYIFYPVSTSKMMKKWNKFGKKHCSKYWTMVVTSAIALFPVWMLNGLWHGPKESYILYGVFYFIVLLIGEMWKPVGSAIANGLHLDEKGKFVSVFRIFRTWIIIGVGETLFRADTFAQFKQMMANIFVKDFFVDIEIHGMGIGMDMGDYTVCLIGIIIVALVDLKLEKNPMFLDNIPKLSITKRWAVYYAFILAIVWFGAYGPGYQPIDLIYAGF